MHQAGAMTWIQSKNSRQLHHLLRLSWNQTNISINVERYTACQIWNPARCIQKRCKYLLRLWHTRLTYAHRGVFTVTHPVYAARILVSAYFGAGAATPARPTAPLNWSEILPAYMIKSIWRGKKKNELGPSCYHLREHDVDLLVGLCIKRAWDIMLHLLWWF